MLILNNSNLEANRFMKPNLTVCVAGASGLVGANIVRAALERGYTVNGTMRDKDAIGKASYLKALPGGALLNLFNANMADKESFDLPLVDADAVFISCLIPTYKGLDGTQASDMEEKQGFAEIIMPLLRRQSHLETNGKLTLFKTPIRPN